MNPEHEVRVLSSTNCIFRILFQCRGDMESAQHAQLKYTQRVPALRLPATERFAMQCNLLLASGAAPQQDVVLIVGQHATVFGVRSQA